MLLNPCVWLSATLLGSERGCWHLVFSKHISVFSQAGRMEELFHSLNHRFQFSLHYSSFNHRLGWAGQQLPRARPAETCRFAAMNGFSRKKTRPEPDNQRRNLPCKCLPKAVVCWKGTGTWLRAWLWAEMAPDGSRQGDKEGILVPFGWSCQPTLRMAKAPI